jgi:hypothetical protein
MAHTCLTVRKSTGRQPTGQLAPRSMPSLQEPRHDSPLHASQEEVPFEIELVVPSSPTPQGAPTEEQQQQVDHDVDNEDEVTMSVKSCTEMLTKGNPSVLKPRSLPAGFVPCWDTWA